MFSFAAKREERREEKTSGTQFQNSKILFSRVHFHTVEFDKTMEIAFSNLFRQYFHIMGPIFSVMSYERNCIIYLQNSAPGLSSHLPKVHLSSRASEQRKVFSLLLGWYWPHPSQASLRMRRFIEHFTKRPISYPEPSNFLQRMLDENEGSGKDQFLGDPDWLSEMQYNTISPLFADF